MLLSKPCPSCGGVVTVRKTNCSCGHVFVAKRDKPVLTTRSASRKHTMSNFIALETRKESSDCQLLD